MDDLDSGSPMKPDNVDFITFQEQSDSDDSDSDSVLCISSDYKIMIEKLDAVLTLVMEYISSLNKKAISQKDRTELSEVYYSFLDIFDRIMLPTHKLRCAQFIIFYLCSLSPEKYPEDFMGLLVTHLLEPSASSVTKVASAAYLGSFIARAKYVSVSSVRHCLRLLNQTCHTYLDVHESELSGQIDVTSQSINPRLIDLASFILQSRLYCTSFVLDGSRL